MRSAFRLLWLAVLTCILTLGTTSGLYAQSMTPLKEQLQADSGGRARITLDRNNGFVRHFGTDLQEGVPMKGTLKAPPTVEEANSNFLAQYGPLFGLEDAQRDLKVEKTSQAKGERFFTRYQQHHQGVPVLGGELVVQSVGADKRVVSANARIVPHPEADVSPQIAAEDAINTALALVSKHYDVDASQLNAKAPELWIYNPTLFGHSRDENYLVWRTEVTPSHPMPIRELVLVDAHRGNVLLHFNQTDTALSRKIYDANNGTSLNSASLARSEGGSAAGDTDTDNAYAYAGSTYDFYFNNHGRDSIDGAGMVLKSFVHYGVGYENAFWDGAEMVYGDGFVADDVAAHEMTHGVTEHTSNLFYYYQSGAINEALSDIWGEFVDLTNGLGNDDPSVRWKLGEDLPASVGIIRDMKNPHSFGDPERMGDSNYYCGDSDNGGVHTNSGVANKAAYLLVDGGSLNGTAITGLSGGIAMAADLFYEVQTHILTSASDYEDLGDALIQAATNLGFSDADKLQVQKVVDATQMKEQPSGCPATEAPAPVCATGETTVLFSDDLENTSSGNWAVAGSWNYPAPSDEIYATSGTHNFWGDDQASTGDYSITMKHSVTLPETGSITMQFNHAYSFESKSSSVGYDGGVVEYSTDGGSTWHDAGSLFTVNGYSSTIYVGDTNPLSGRKAFSGISGGYISSRLDLTPLAGESVRFRFRIGTDSMVGDWGWYVDDIIIFQCGTPGSPSADPLTVTSPNGGESWQVGSNQTISWTYGAPAGSRVTIELLRGDSVEKVIKRRTSLGKNGGKSVSWRVPRKVAPGDTFRVRLTTDTGQTDVSDQVFSIVPAN